MKRVGEKVSLYFGTDITEKRQHIRAMLEISKITYFCVLMQFLF